MARSRWSQNERPADLSRPPRVASGGRSFAPVTDPALGVPATMPTRSGGVVHPILALQRVAGNRAVVDLLGPHEAPSHAGRASDGPKPTVQRDRVNISRDQTGGPVQPAQQGAASRKVTVRCSYHSKVDIQGCEQVIWETAAGGRQLHQSSKIKQAPVGMLGYIHNLALNRLLAVTRLDPAKRTIEIARQGEAKAGWHVFK